MSSLSPDGATMLDPTRRSSVRITLLTALAMGVGVSIAGDEPKPKPSPRRVLRVAADPNNLPFTNERKEGFENKIAALLALDLGVELEYVWRAQRRGFFRSALKEDGCDLILAVPAGFERTLTTAPYYRSTYVFISRRGRRPAIRSFDDPSLRSLKIGVQLIGDDGVNTPPAHALAARGIVDNVVGFTVYGDYAQANPPARVVDAVARGDVDVAIVWGPLAGYFGRRGGFDLEITPVEPAAAGDGPAMAFDIAMGVRKGDKELRDRLDAALRRQAPQITKILDDYGIPRVPLAGVAAGR
jgi:mxaJ protein